MGDDGFVLDHLVFNTGDDIIRASNLDWSQVDGGGVRDEDFRDNHPGIRGFHTVEQMLPGLFDSIAYGLEIGLGVILLACLILIDFLPCKRPLCLVQQVFHRCAVDKRERQHVLVDAG